MTFNTLKTLILEGAPDDRLRREARDAMNHSSYTSFSFRITNPLRLSSLTNEQKEDMVVSRTLNFYENDLPRYRRTGSFDKYPTKRLNHE